MLVPNCELLNDERGEKQAWNSSTLETGTLTFHLSSDGDAATSRRTNAGGLCVLAFTQLAPQSGGISFSLLMVLAPSPSWKTFCRVDCPSCLIEKLGSRRRSDQSPAHLRRPAAASPNDGVVLWRRLGKLLTSSHHRSSFNIKRHKILMGFL